MDYRMSRRTNNAIYFYLGSYGNVQMDKDTGSERHQMRYDIGNYIPREKIYEAQKAFFEEKFPTLSKKEIEDKIRKAEELAKNKK
ncbi:hypothetical protein IR148_00520 [Dysgonomonas mossii]|uniref:Uncharacterized protein n=1 Tax=Dysgonomonas mossii TaxID=163665 RepID=A0A4Y9IPQ9_9BACT|nr:hypothetical protein [Dysgonomonas mossii]MBF0759525.1 hypothetical protein [Dysgonomonas mossii]TFU90493.1 hypothetical protein E4T88_00520 [Dysgonomonas mossii]